jgi:hypothetical protein
MLIMWRGWFLRNDIKFGKGRETIMGSAKFLLSYSETLNGLSQSRRKVTDDKGKASVDEMITRPSAMKK